jgi:hypothetical protein
LAYDPLIFLQRTERIYDVLKWQGIKNLSQKEIEENNQYNLQIMNSRREGATLSLSLAATKDAVIKQTHKESKVIPLQARFGPESG